MATSPASPARLVWLRTTTSTAKSAGRVAASEVSSADVLAPPAVAFVCDAFGVVDGLALDVGAWLSASRVDFGEVVEAAALGWPGSSPRHTASEVISDATARTASSDGSTAPAIPWPVRCAPWRGRGARRAGGTAHDGLRR